MALPRLKQHVAADFGRRGTSSNSQDGERQQQAKYQV